MALSKLFFRFAAVIVSSAFALNAAPALAATACTLDDLTAYMSQCFDPSVELSSYQKLGQAEIIEGRYCNDGGLIADGFLICLGHDLMAVRLGSECWRAEHMKAAKKILAEDDPRKVVKCGELRRNF
jgi:hypothetical protein